MYYYNSCYNCYFNFNHRNFFWIIKKQNGGSIIVKYVSKENDKVIDLFNKGNLDEKDYEIKLISNNTLPIRDLSGNNIDQNKKNNNKYGRYV